MEFAVAQSFAKIMCLYGERTGALHFVCASKQIADVVLSNVKIIVRRNYSSPPRHGARIAAMILHNPQMRKEWEGEVMKMTQRMKKMRKLLHQHLVRLGAKGP